MIRRNLPTRAWRKSSYSDDQNQDCVEFQLTTDGLVAVGDSKDRERGAFLFTPRTWSTFVGAVRRGLIAGHPSLLDR
ncbi:DUF397 domain-containing protein [Streptomyces sp. NPDC049577]|uniref:DUF397 domain-containing protein n=1 Tax=Streptomyces sp. NPDC049577 TaxID=3155153 RepID=UPI003428C2FA